MHAICKRSRFLSVLTLGLALGLAGACAGELSEPEPGGEDVHAQAAVTGLGPWTGTDNVKASAKPPGGLTAAQVPQLVGFGFDDNGYSGLPGSNGEGQPVDGGVHWAVQLAKGKTNPDGSKVKLSFYPVGTYAGVWSYESPTWVKRAWHEAVAAGHEVGNHSYSHSHGEGYDVSGWKQEISDTTAWLVKPYDASEDLWNPNPAKGAGQAAAKIYGFRAPYLEYSDATFAAVDELGFRYDCSIEDGWQASHNGKNYFWPYTLDNGSPGHDALVALGLKAPIDPHAGLWELPIHPFIVPPDALAAKYGIPVGLRGKLKARVPWFDAVSGKVTGYDFNLWVTFGMTKAEFLATLEYTFDLRYDNNRAPLMIGLHSDIYSSRWQGAPNATAKQRRAAIEEFMAYVLSKPAARVTSNAGILEWVRNPVAL
jgi:peptidoglycan/xylan/chitin deacetylase (PgdA/CDA1 family)